MNNLFIEHGRRRHVAISILSDYALCVRFNTTVIVIFKRKTT